jgi:hypothetical protein
VQPSRQLMNHIMARRITLNELFVDGREEMVEGEFLEKMQLVALCRIIGVFVHATDPRDKKGTDNYIVGCDRTLTDLVYYVATHMKHSRTFVRPTDLPAQYVYLNDHWRDTVRGEAVRLLLADLLIDLRDKGDIWYDEGRGIWQIKQSLISQYEALRRQVGIIVTPRQAPSIKEDRRTFHGRPDQQGRRRAKENGNAGASIGGVR